ncbi:MAG TPA: flagellin [Terriglobia bacterium]|nr:flagellin [Terriglobia bacterium]
MPVISTNTAANTALRYLNNNASEQSSALAKLASGSNITKASDDAAGLAIGTQLNSDVSVLNQASTNASQASSILQVADGGLSSIADILTRMKSLATEAASGNVTDAQRTNDIDTEYQQLLQEIDSIASGTRYSNNSLLDGTSSYASGVSFLVGTSAADTITVTISASNASALSLTGTSLTTASAATTLITTLTSAIDTITQDRALIGAQESRFNFHSQNIATTTENTDAAQSTIMDADVASQKSKLSSADVKYQASVAALAQANQIPKELLTLLQS